MLATSVIRPICYALLLFTSGSGVVEPTPMPRLVRAIEAHSQIVDSSGAQVIVTSDRIQFLSPAGRPVKELLLPHPESTRVTLSKNGRATLLQTIAHGTSDKGSDSIELRVLNRDGALLWATDDMSIGPLYFSEADGPRVVERVCHEGGCTAAVRIIDPTHPQGLRITPSVDPSAQSSGGDIAANGKNFAVTFRTDPDRWSLLYFDIDGPELWSHHKEGASGSDVAVSPAGNFVATAIRELAPRTNGIYLFSRDGSVIAREDADYVGDHHFAFSDDETTLAVGASGGKLVVFDTSSRKVRWRYSTGDANTGFTDLDVCNDFVIASVTTIDPNDISNGSLPRFVYLFDRDGKVLIRMKFDGDKFETWREGPRVQFVRPNGMEVLITLKDRILTYAR